MTSSNGNIFRVTGPLCGEFTGPGEFPAQRQVTRSFDVFFDLCQDKHLSKQCWGWWFETPSCPLSWCHCIETGLLSALDDSQCRHYLNQCWLTVSCTPQIVMIIAHAMNFCERRDALSGLESCWNWVPIIGTTPRYKLGWNLNHTRKFVFHRNTIKIATIAFRPAYVNSLWPSDALWRHRCWPTLAQVMACQHQTVI